MSIKARRKATLPSRLMESSRRLPADSYWAGDRPDAIQLAGTGPPRRVADRGCVVAGTDHRPAGHAGQRRERCIGQQLAIWASAAAI
jgi:hypothetical protein